MTTPDTEWQEDFFEYFKGNIDGESKLHCNTKYVREFIQQLLTSRDTYWEERVRKEVPNALHEYAKWLLENPDAEPLVRRAKKNEIACAITNEDNLK